MYIRVKVTPGARRDSVITDGHGAYHISVTEPAERNRANTRVREILAGELDVPVSRLRLISGHTGRTKIFSLLEKGSA